MTGPGKKALVCAHDSRGRFSTRAAWSSLLVALCPSVASASGGFTYDVPAGCPERGDFVRWVEQKLTSPGAVEQRLDGMLRALRVSADAKSALLIFGEAGGASERTLSAEGCDELIVSAALISAMALENEDTESVEPASGANAPTPSEPSVAAGQAEVLAAPTSSDPEAPLAPPTAVPEAERPRLARAEPTPKPPAKPKAETKSAQKTPAPVVSPAASSPASEWRWGTGLGARLDGWSGPGTAWGGDVVLQLAPSPRTWAARSYLVYTRSRAELDGRAAEFQTFGVGLEGCVPVVRAAGTDAGVELCARATLGALAAEGVAGGGLQTVSDDLLFWADGALLLRGMSPEWQSLRLELQGEVGSALREHRFEFEAPDRLVFHPRPRLAAGARLGLVFQW